MPWKNGAAPMVVPVMRVVIAMSRPEEREEICGG